MKKYILTWILVVLVFIAIPFLVYFLYVPELKQSNKTIYEKERLRNLEQKILFYENDGNANKILEDLYDEKGNIYRYRKKYSEAYNCYQKSLTFAQQNNNKRHEVELIWFLVYLASAQEKSDLVLSLCDKYKDFKDKKNKNDTMPSLAYYYWEGLAQLRKKQIDSAIRNLSKGFKLIDKKKPLFYPGYFSRFCCALSIAYSQKQEFKKSIEYLDKAVDVFLEVNSVASIKYNKEGHKLLNSALSILEKANFKSLELSLLYQKVAKIYKYENEQKFNEYLLKTIKVLEELKAKKEKIAALYYELGAVKPYDPNKYFDKCIAILKGVKGRDAASIVFKIAYASYDESSEESLRLLLLSLKTLPASDKTPLWIARAYHLIAYCYSERKEWQKSAEYGQKCLELVKKNDNIEIRFTLALDCYSFLDHFYKSQENLKKRITNAEDAVVFMNNKKCDFILQNAAHEELGKIYKLDKRYSDSENSYKGIIKIMNKNPKLRENTAYLKQEINAYCQIGDLCLLQKAKVRALTAFNEASRLIKRKTISESSKWYIAKVFMNIADGYYYLHKDDLAEKYYKKLLALLLAKNKKDHRAIAYVCHRIGNIAFGQKKVKKSHDYFKKGLKFALTAYKKQKNKYGNNLTTGMCAADIGAFYDQLKQKDKALEFLQVAHQLLKKHGENQPELAERISRHIKKLQK